jgi:hypothetical protein
MRKYDKKNKRNIGIILAIAVIIVIIFSYFIYRVISISKIEYKVLDGSILYDDDKNMIELEGEGLIKVKWSSKYYLVYNNSSYLLGDDAVVYTPNSGSVSLYGKFYEIKSDATVEIKEDETKLENSSVSHFYKIEDRKYLLVSSKIYTENNELNTSNYLIVELDRSGNATLYNNEVNLKTMTETKIITNDYTFDIANEVLMYGENNIDLKKIIGSTNEYSPKDLLVEEEDNSSDNSTNNSNGNSTNNTVNNTNNVVNNTTIYENASSNGDSSDNSVVTDSIEVSKRTSVIRVVPSITSISIDYVVYDPKDEYKSVYVEVVNSSNSTASLVYLNKNNTNISINNLSPNTKFKLNFYYTYYEGDSMVSDRFNSIEVSTKVPVISMSLGNVTSSSIGYVVSLDDKYNIDSATIEVLVDNLVVYTYKKSNIGNVDMFSDSIDVSGYDLSGGIVTVRLSNIVFEGYSYNTNVYYKFNY